MVMVSETPPEANEDDGIVIEPSVRRKRGRPRNDENKTGADGEKKPDQNKPKRRKKGQATTDEIMQRAQMIAGVHYTLAMFTGLHELQLSQPEAMSLASASLNAENEFGFEINTKAVAMVTLIGTMGSIYVPRAMAVSQRIKAERAQKEKEQQAGNNPAEINPNIPPEMRRAA